MINDSRPNIKSECLEGFVAEPFTAHTRNVTGTFPSYTQNVAEPFRVPCPCNNHGRLKYGRLKPSATGLKSVDLGHWTVINKEIDPGGGHICRTFGMDNKTYEWKLPNGKTLCVNHLSFNATNASTQINAINATNATNALTQTFEL